MLNIFKKTAQNISSIMGKKTKNISKDELENILIEADIQYDIVDSMLEHLPETISKNQLEVALDRFFRGESYYDKATLKPIKTKPLVELIIGVNGAGKTTTIAKLAKMYKSKGKKVLLGAGDTFRAAASEQLKLWSEKIGVGIISAQNGADPSALAYDSIQAAIARDMDNVIIDTAGRLHNQTNLKNELIKISRTCAKALGEKDFRKILILDGTQGSSALSQAKIFHETLQVDGVIITKLDGTSKGGAILSILYELKLPIMFLGMGEKEDDLIPFDEKAYIQSILESIFE
ncbi:signal recognition particle-docking protein FtsY [Helicobacter cappadocius]|uniref:Signal recognition particle receptor FtsY n=1 Tax=Helicobacter cappadocius TaxID=3063998 RepID=A0AA90PRC5_9HELI|nr:MULTISPECIES: signal recognition particle-docking protein FtsY [unclassified Helicobacter]MDO7253152.1 signal recognition particle-docking protein FtsY [Helicobacter sp. faydin-H75]MDP2538722.1 signal recognition particle-docking protein FtsY [Helicobacter sp. faydin-H76]